jgi:DNA repair ATPase RecN
MRVTLGAAAAAALVVMPGCIVGEIRDDLKEANEELRVVAQIQSDLAKTNETLAAVKADLARTSEMLTSVKGELTTTNQTMAAVEKRLEVLDPIGKSLTSLDDSLKTVKGLIEKIPFVGSSSDKDKEKDGQGGASGATGSTGATGATEPPKPAGK